jgi:hypothetical protein
MSLDRLLLAALLLLTVALRLSHLNAPLADALQAKQVYSANKARQIATPPFDPLRLTLGVLDESGKPMALVEEIPVYITMLAGLYRLLGEREIWGRLLSIAGSVVAVAAFVALARREHGRRAALVGGLLLSVSPLFVFYGRAVMPDSWMLAAMLVAAWAYRRYLDDGRRPAWLLATIAAAVAAVGFKYWGLMILVVLAEMARRAEGRAWRAWLRPSFVGMVAAIVLPVALWMVLVFLRQRNPVADGWTAGQKVSPPYLVIQDPSILLDRRWYAAAVRFLVRDGGPITAGLIVLGILNALRRRIPPGFASGGLAGWTLMGGLFFVLLAPKLVDHDYYALMLLPAASLWAARGYLALESRVASTPSASVGRGADEESAVAPLARVCPSPARVARAESPGRPRAARGSRETPANDLARPALRPLPAAILLLAVLLHSPWLSGSRFRVESGKVALGRALAAASSPGGRVVALGPGIALITAVHYSGRAGWAERFEGLPSDWPRRVARWRAQGAECLGVYLDARATPAQRAAFDPLLDALPVVARGTAAGAQYAIVRLDDAAIARLPDSALRR